LQGNKVFVISSSASRNAKPLQHQQLFFYKLLWYSCTCNALRAVFTGLSYSLQFLLIPHGSSCVLHATLFITSSVTFHFTSFVAFYLLQLYGIPGKHTILNRHAHTILQASLHYSLGFISLHYVIHSFQ